MPLSCNFNACIIKGWWMNWVLLKFLCCYSRQYTEQTVDLMVAKVTMAPTQMHCDGSILSNDSLAPRRSGCGSKNAIINASIIYMWNVSQQLSCGDTCQIWVWFTAFNRCVCKIGNFAYGEIREWSFSNPQHRTYDNDPTWIPKDLTDMISRLWWG